MAPMILYHSTRENYLEDVLATGLEPRLPADWNYPSMHGQPEGIYTYPEGERPWRYGPLLRFPYVGPMAPDPLLERAIVVLEPIPPENLELVEDE